MNTFFAEKPPIDTEPARPRNRSVNLSIALIGLTILAETAIPRTNHRFHPERTGSFRIHRQLNKTAAARGWGIHSNLKRVAVLVNDVLFSHDKKIV